MNFVNIYSLSRNYIVLETCRALSLNRLEFPSPKDASCQVWLKLPSGSRYCIYAISNHLLEKGRILLLVKGWFCAKFSWNWSDGSWEVEETWFVYDNNEDDNDDDRQLQWTNCDPKSSSEPSASLNIYLHYIIHRSIYVWNLQWVLIINYVYSI